VNNSAFSYQPGDRILFQRGGTWRGEVIMGTFPVRRAQNITIGAYGSGAKPLIKGSELMSGWSQLQRQHLAHIRGRARWTKCT
jgi:hypothetical protein